MCLAKCGLCAHNADGAELFRSTRPQTGQSPWPPCPRPPGRLQKWSPSDTNWRTRPATQAPRAGKMPGRKSCFSRSKRKRSDTVVVFDAHERRWAARGGHKADARSTRGLASQKIGSSGRAQRGSIASRARTSLMSCPPSRTRGHAQYSATSGNVAEFFWC